MRFRLVGSLLAALLVVNLTSTMWLSCAGDPMTGGRMTGGQMICCGADGHDCQGATDSAPTTYWTGHPGKQRVVSADDGSASPEVWLADARTVAAGRHLSVDGGLPLLSLRQPHAPPYLLNQVFRI